MYGHEGTGGEQIVNRSDVRLKDMEFITVRSEKGDVFLSLSTLEPGAFFRAYPRLRDPQRKVDVSWTESAGQKRTQSIDLVDPSRYRGKTIVFIFDGTIWSAEPAAW